MKFHMRQTFALSLILFVGFLTGCSKTRSQTALDPAKIPETINKTFANAPDATKETASNYVSAFQSQDTSGAFMQLEQMNQDPNLTPQQRQVVAKAMQTTFVKLQAAAQNGDTAAQATMHSYLSAR